ncbi:hypothetical protein GPJ56_001650 [Histomonas meleagridis]|uniref:uncharacterized protein n=1 Tax=Histomonas meleagridis TaxID=135588 RepID=UPI00355A1D0A|nr:hypothetical protein GPJ56_001650 [Histomonas meleagridis]KAH0796264.1 hypothetical protein GO595_010157 [Histomonas meleagridis]
MSNVIKDQESIKRHKSENEPRNKTSATIDLSQTREKKSSNSKISRSAQLKVNDNESTNINNNNNNNNNTNVRVKKTSKHIPTDLNHFFDYIKARINLHIPLNDVYTRRIDSDNEINEDNLIQKLSLKNTIINYYTIGQSLLISFIENKDNVNQYVIFARGPFGKSIWTLNDDYQSDLATPKISTITSTNTTKESNNEININNILEKIGDPIQMFEYDKMDPNEIKDLSNLIHKKYEELAKSKIDWEKFGEYYPFNYHGPQQRYKVIDFLTTLGMFEHNNKYDIRQQNNLELVKKAISDFDNNSITSLIPLQIIHLLPSDNDIGYKDEHVKRMTPLMLKFLNSIGEKIMISDEAAKKREFPLMKCPVPALLCSSGFIAFISPALTNDQNAIEKIEKLNAPIKIVFNETNFRINYTKSEGDEAVIIVIKPNELGMYSVTEVAGNKEILSPFALEQTMSIETLAFYISYYVESMEKLNNKNKIRERRAAFAELCKKHSNPELGLLSSRMFDKNFEDE